MIPQVNSFSIVFWKNLKTLKRHFEINWPLVKSNFFDQFLEELRIPKSSFEIKWPLLEWGVEVIFEGTWAPVFSGTLYFYFRYYKLCTYFVSPVWKLYNPYCHKSCNRMSYQGHKSRIPKSFYHWVTISCRMTVCL